MALTAFVDAVSWLSKDALLTDDDENPNYIEGERSPYEFLLHNNSKAWPAVFAYLRELSDVLKEEQYQNKFRFMVTESYPENMDSLFVYMMFYVGMDPEVAAPFNFEGTGLAWEAAAWQRFFKRFHAQLMQFSPLCVPSNAFGNHDLSRLVTRIGAERARAVSLMLMTLPGMAFVYYGEEIGMENGHIPANMVQDPAEKAQKKRGTGRDPERTPMQWSVEKNAGFSNGPSTWLPIADNYPIRNVEAESEQPDSFLSLYRQLGKLRSGSDAIRYGNFTVLESGDEQVLMFERSLGHEPRYITCVNFSEKPTKCHMPYMGQSFRDYIVSSMQAKESR